MDAYIPPVTYPSLLNQLHAIESDDVQSARRQISQREHQLSETFTWAWPMNGIAFQLALFRNRTALIRDAFSQPRRPFLMGMNVSSFINAAIIREDVDWFRVLIPHDIFSARVSIETASLLLSSPIADTILHLIDTTARTRQFDSQGHFIHPIYSVIPRGAAIPSFRYANEYLRLMTEGRYEEVKALIARGERQMTLADLEAALDGERFLAAVPLIIDALRINPENDTFVFWTNATLKTMQALAPTPVLYLVLMSAGDGYLNQIRRDENVLRAAMKAQHPYYLWLLMTPRAMSWQSFERYLFDEEVLDDTIAFAFQHNFSRSHLFVPSGETIRMLGDMDYIRAVSLEQILSDTERVDLNPFYQYVIQDTNQDMVRLVLEVITNGPSSFTAEQINNLERLDDLSYVMLTDDDAQPSFTSFVAPGGNQDGFWDVVSTTFYESDAILDLYLNFFASFCSTMNNASDDDVELFRSTLLQCADVLELSLADKVLLRRRKDASSLCQWMERKQKERVHSIEPGTHDALTLTSCEDIPLLFLIVIENTCFDIVSLWTYLRNNRSPEDVNPLNPATQRQFTNEQLQRIRHRYMATFTLLNTFRDIIRNTEQ